MKPYFALGLFALYVVLASLLGLLTGRELPRLTAMRRMWGGTRGPVLLFGSRVALPLVLGIVFLSLGVSEYSRDPYPLLSPLHHQAVLGHLRTSAAGAKGSSLLVSATVIPGNSPLRLEAPAWEFVHQEALR